MIDKATGPLYVHGVYMPWLNPKGEFADLYRMAQNNTVVGPASAFTIYTTLRNLLHNDLRRGEIWECGVWRGGTAKIIAEIVNKYSLTARPIRLFDTFAGMPEPDAGRDWHKRGDFADTSRVYVEEAVGTYPDLVLEFNEGFFADTFPKHNDSKILFAHVDADLYPSIKTCVEFIYPRLVSGGAIIFDDYGLPTCPGARDAVDEFCAAHNILPLVLLTGQAVITKP